MKTKETQNMKFLPLLAAIWACTFADQTHDGLRVTWDLNPFNKYAFDALPRDLNNDDLDGFVMKDTQCSTDGSFRGVRYWKNSDSALMTLYDVNGYIAGVQTSVLKSAYTPSGPMTEHPWMTDGDHWTLTMYFVDPTIICNTGRTADQYVSQGTGTGLWFQNGPNPETDCRKAPENESDVASTTKWGLGHCFITMGNHYWYDVSSGMSCDDFFPFFLLYNNGKINAGGFAFDGTINSGRYEHPPLSKFMNPEPDCFGSGSFSSLTTMHVYMTDSPRTGCLC